MKLSAGKIIALALIGGLLYVSAPSIYAGYQNYNGVCLAEGRVLTEDELIRRYAERYYIGSHDYATFANIRLPDGTYKSLKKLPFSNYEDFLRFNQNCCQIKNARLDMNFAARVAGNARGVFTGKILVRYKDEAGNMAELRGVGVEGTLIGNCAAASE